MIGTEEKKTGWIFAAFGLIWTVYAGFTILHVYGPIIVPDEFGYWAHAAGYAGYDWHTVTSNFSYYSFGYGILMYPFFRFIENPVFLYRTIVGVNFLLVWSGTLLLYKVLVCVFPLAEKKRIALISGTAMLYVAYTAYVQVTLCETLLAFLYVFLGYAVSTWSEKASVGNTVLVLCIAGYMYAVHMRTVGILLATAVYMLFFLCLSGFSRKKAVAAGIILLILCCIFFGVAAVKDAWITQSNSETYENLAEMNSYAGQIGKIQYLMTWSGIYHFLASFAGKIFYMGCSSFGIYFWGIAYLVKQVIQAGRKIRKKEEINSSARLLIWVLLSHSGALAVAVIAMTSEGGRLDSVLYGRYFENSVSIILGLGIYDILDKTNYPQMIKRYISIQSILFFFLFFLIQGGSYTSLNTHSVTGIIYAVLLADRYDNYILLYAYLGGMAGSILILLMCRFFAKKKQKYIVCAVICALQLCLSFISAGDLAMADSDSKREDSRILMEAAELLDDRQGIFLVDQGKFKTCCFAQYILRNPLRIMTSEEYLKDCDDAAMQKECFVVAVRYSDMEKTLMEQYDQVLQSPNYSVFFSIRQ